MYRMIIIYLDGTLRGMEISQSTSVKLEVGKIRDQLCGRKTIERF